MKIINVFLFFFLIGFYCQAQNAKPFKEVDQNELVKQTQKNLASSNQIKMVWWIPTEFWQVIYAKQPNISQNIVDQIVNSLSQYTFVGIVDGKVGLNGTIDYSTEAEVRKNITIIDSLNKVYKPLDDKNLEATTQLMLNTLKPVLQNMLGTMGDHFYFIAFENKNSGGNALLSPYYENGSRINFYKTIADFNVPLPSLIADKICPNDKKEMNGTWKYCPYHGVELIDQ